MKSILVKLFIIGLCVCFFPIQAIAQEPMEGFTGWHKIEWLYQRECTDDRGFEVTLKADHDNPAGCDNARVLEVPCRYRPYRAMVAMFLEAFSDDYEVRAYVRGCDGDGHSLVNAVQFRKAEEVPESE